MHFKLCLQKYIFHLCIHDILRIYEILTTPVNTSSAIFIMIQASIILTNFYFITYISFSFKAVIFAIYAFMIFCVYMKLKKKPVNTSSAISIMIQVSIILTKYSFIQCDEFLFYYLHFFIL